MKVAYIAGKYRDKYASGIHDNIEKARAVAVEYWKKGFAVICPHLNTAYFDGACDDNVWLEGDIEILKRCDVLVVLPSWEESLGTKAEIKIAEEYGVEIIYYMEE